MEHLTKKEKVTIMLASMAAMLFASLNQTIISTALPRIIASLGGMELYSWAFTIYILTSTIVMIMVGRLSDIYGRKVFLVIGISVFMLGSLLSGTAHTILLLIIYRGLQGFGAGMIFASSIAAIGDLFTPKERGRWQGLMASVFGLSSLIGPILGGYIVDYWNWPWVFWINLPVGVLALVLIYKLFPNIRGERAKIDYLGSFYLMIAMVTLLFGFSFAGVKYDWFSLHIVSLLSISLIFLLLFIRTEKRVTSPILPLSLFQNKTFAISSVIGFLTGFTLFSTVMFVPLFVQGAMGISATQSGLILMPMMLSWVTASAISGQITSRTGNYKLLSLTGLALVTVGLFLLSRMTMDTSPLIVVRNLVFTGLGLGIVMPTFMLIVQNALPHNVLGVVSSSTQLFRQLGGTIGVAVMGTIMTTKMQKELVQGVTMEEKSLLEETGLSELKDPQILLDPDFLNNIKSSLSSDMLPLFNDMQLHLQRSLGISIESVFFLGFATMLAAFLLSLFLKEIPLRDKAEGPKPENEKHLPNTQEVPPTSQTPLYEQKTNSLSSKSS
jgi:EmrB/QacA subfamily drug resistance transporter